MMSVIFSTSVGSHIMFEYVSDFIRVSDVYIMPHNIAEAKSYSFYFAVQRTIDGAHAHE